MKRIVRIILILSVAMIAGCYYDNEERLYPVLPTSCNLTNVTYSATIQPLLQFACYSCHSNANYAKKGLGYKLENYDDVVTNISKILVSVQLTNSPLLMPLGGKLSDCEISQLKKWSDNGTPNN